MGSSAAAAALALVLTASPAADFEVGMEAFAKEDFETAHREWAPLAAAGHADAQYSLGAMYMQGLGVDVSPAEAARWFRLAGEQGQTEAQFTLGMMKSQGLGGPVDLAEAARWYRKAARQGSADAQLALGLMLVRGSVREPDFVEAAHWFRRAAADGNPAAYASLGLLFETGRGVPQNDVCAYAWYSLAAAGDNEAARQKRDALRTGMVPEQVARGQSFSRSPAFASQCPVEARTELVAAVRERLIALGYLSETQGDTAFASAVRSFQGDLGLTPTGQISDELLMLMRQRDK